MASPTRYSQSPVELPLDSWLLEGAPGMETPMTEEEPGMWLCNVGAAIAGV